jgi:hypothetical protein
MAGSPLEKQLHPLLALAPATHPEQTTQPPEWPRINSYPFPPPELAGNASGLPRGVNL